MAELAPISDKRTHKAFQQDSRHGILRLSTFGHCDAQGQQLAFRWRRRTGGTTIHSHRLRAQRPDAKSALLAFGNWPPNGIAQRCRRTRCGFKQARTRVLNPV